MSYLEPPPMPAPVVVMKDVGGFVNQYQAQTELYRAADREVRLHECRSACTLALSLPNVCVYPDSTLKFHLAYDPRNHQSNYDVSRQLFNAYPPAVRERLGGLTRQYKALRGAELIALGVRQCGQPRPGAPGPGEARVMVASVAPPKPAPAPQEPRDSMLGGLMRNMASMFGAGPQAQPMQARVEMARLAPGRAPDAAELAPLPPPRPADVAGEDAAQAEAADEGGSGAAGPQITYAYGMARVISPPKLIAKVMDGAQPILPARFIAAELLR